MEHSLDVNIYYEDTDCGGVVYYANYLKYFERARTEYLKDHHISFKELMDQGVYFVVVKATLQYHHPGAYGDVLRIASMISNRGPASLDFSHTVTRKETGELLVTGEVKIASVSKDMKPQRLPASVLNVL
jgi:acyl-CoA thioester hydrolase